MKEQVDPKPALSDERFGEIAYLYMKYGTRYASLLRINQPLNSLCAMRWAIEATATLGNDMVDPPEMHLLLKQIEGEIKEHDFTSITHNERVPEDKKRLLVIATAFVTNRIGRAVLAYDKDARVGLQMFCDEAGITRAEGRLFFIRAYEQAHVKKLAGLFDEKDWK